MDYFDKILVYSNRIKELDKYLRPEERFALQVLAGVEVEGVTFDDMFNELKVRYGK